MATYIRNSEEEKCEQETHLFTEFLRLTVMDSVLDVSGIPINEVISNFELQG